MTLQNLATTFKWTPERLIEFLDKCIDPTPPGPVAPLLAANTELVVWLEEIAGVMGHTLGYRGAVRQALRLFYCVGSDVTAPRKAMETVPYSLFTPREILAIGVVNDAFSLAIYPLDCPQGGR